MNYQNVINARKRQIKAFVELGDYSLNDIAEFFYTIPDYIRIDIEKMGYSVDMLPYSSATSIESLLQYRNHKVIEDLVTLSIDDVLEKYGLAMIPYELPKERTDFPCKEYKALWDGYEFCDLPGYLNESRAQVKKSLRKAGYAEESDYRKIKKLGKAERKIALASEMLGYLETFVRYPEIREIMNLSEGESSKIRQELIDQGALDKNGNIIKYTSAIEEGIYRGFTQRQIAFFLNSTDDYVFNICKRNHFMEKVKAEKNSETDTPMAFRKQELKEKVYVLHKYEGWTQQEIADHFKLSRATINHYIKDFRANHKIEFDQTYLVRLRNQTEEKRERTEQLKSDIGLLTEYGMSQAAIAECLKISLSTVSKHMLAINDERMIDAMQSEHYLRPSHAAINERRGKILDMKLDGVSIQEIQKETKVGHGTVLRDRKLLQASLQAYHPKALKEIKKIRAGEELKDYETYATPSPSRPYATAVLGMYYNKKQETEKALQDYEEKKGEADISKE